MLERRINVIKFKKFNCLILSFLIVISAFSFSFITNAEIIKIGVITEPGENKIGVVLRKDASSSSAKLITLADGTTVTALDTKKDISGKDYIWQQVQYTASGITYTGYIRSDMIKVTDYNTDPTFEEQLKDFPRSYHDDLIKLHAMFPNWTFRADKLTVTFVQAVALEDKTNIKLINGSYASLRSLREGCYDWSTNQWITYEGGWYGASTELIAYYMDPRNFLNANDIYMYLKQGYDANSQTQAGVQKIIDGSFIAGKVTDKNDSFYDKTYAEVIMEAGKQSNVNPYILASTIIQEQGTDGATLGKGTAYNGKTVYNFFHWKATGKTDADIIKNGSAYAYNNSWFTPSASIIGGAKMYGGNYVSKGQDTYFYKNYNIIPPVNVNHQYAQNAADSYSSAKKLYKMYSEDKETNLTFRIPVYAGELPQKISPYPEKTNNLNNYYFNTIEVEGLTPSFNRFKYDYSLSVNKDTEIYFQLPNGASLSSANTYNLKKGANTVILTVKSQTGFTKNYTINVDAESPCKLTLTNQKNTQPSVVTVEKGDTNGDNKITTTDLANVRLHLLKLITLKGNGLKGADTNNDGKITTTDLANIRLHLLKLIELK